MEESQARPSQAEREAQVAILREKLHFTNTQSRIFDRLYAYASKVPPVRCKTNDLVCDLGWKPTKNSEAKVRQNIVAIRNRLDVYTSTRDQVKIKLPEGPGYQLVFSYNEDVGDEPLLLRLRHRTDFQSLREILRQERED